MKEYSFIFEISKPPIDFETAAERLYAAGCNDSLLSTSSGKYKLTFSRKAKTFAIAIQSAMDDFTNSNIGSKILKIYRVSL